MSSDLFLYDIFNDYDCELGSFDPTSNLSGLFMDIFTILGMKSLKYDN